MRRAAALLLLTGVAAIGASVALAAGTASITLNEFKVVPKPATAKAGKVTFTVRNTGKLEHELVVIKTNLAPGKLPLTSKGRAIERGAVGEAEVKPGRTAKLTLTLKAGKYALICNLPGHYKAGQYAGFVVK